MPNRARARELAAASLRSGDPLGWFERLYQEAERGISEVPWADLCPNPHLLAFWKSHPLQAAGKSAVVIGCGLGDDAEQLATWGFRTTAFDISETAIRAARKRFPESAVESLVADLLAAPAAWLGNFDFVLEVYTLQVLPENIRPQAIEKIARFLRTGGALLLLARGRDKADPLAGIPWPLTREELQGFTRAGLQEISFEDYVDRGDEGVRRFRALYSNFSTAMT
ncbi:MAG: class I SAM-dependent methyltransferase [Candidatus Acidiferrales bacterium]